ncbi:MAG: FtsH protease activity modulator HflK [Nitrospina sp.]|jgi:modulator of FtsH protease HflK|nr:FtsH protease activity modulator HflK [Nitrospina sp.]MBT5631687.1 FtsH protease activity modulator HflK [Nitrospina sp.]
MPWDDLHEPKGSEDRFKGGGGQGGGGPQKPPFDIPQIKIPQFKPSMILWIILLLLVVWILPGTFYFVEPDEEGVVTRFGKFNRTTSPGLHFKFPSPIEHAATPKIRQVQRAEIGFRASEGRPIQRVPAESLMLTGDQNIIDINLVVQYRIMDSVKYLFNVRRPHKLIRDATETVIRGITGSKKIDEALTTGKAEIQVLAKDQIQELLDRYESGLQIVALQLQDVHPPEQVEAAFKDVVSAREDKERMINEAQGYRNTIIPEARGQAAKIVREAEGYREQNIKRAQGDANRFLQQYEEYKKAPDITRKRIYLETMEEVLPNINKFIMENKGSGVLPVLPLGGNLLGGNK